MGKPISYPLERIDSMFLKVLFEHFTVFDMFIIVMGFFNCTVIFSKAYANASKVYDYLQPRNRTSGMKSSTRKALENATSEARSLSVEDLLEHRKQTNSWYSIFCNLTTIFPLLGMLGTVISLIPMVDNIGTIETGLFFGALTSTFWGIICAISGKVEDAFISPIINDNELYMDHYFNPTGTGSRGDDE